MTFLLEKEREREREREKRITHLSSLTSLLLYIAFRTFLKKICLNIQAEIFYTRRYFCQSLYASFFSHSLIT